VVEKFRPAAHLKRTIFRCVDFHVRHIFSPYANLQLLDS
jgi:hypothetical protein